MVSIWRIGEHDVGEARRGRRVLVVTAAEVLGRQPHHLGLDGENDHVSLADLAVGFRDDQLPPRLGYFVSKHPIHATASPVVGAPHHRRHPRHRLAKLDVQP